MNKRVFRRTSSPLIPVKVEAESELSFGFLKDVSCFGISMFGIKPLTVGKTYDIEFTLPELGDPVRCSATVRWHMKHQHFPSGVSRHGLMFENIEPELSGRLDDLVNDELPRLSA